METIANEIAFGWSCRSCSLLAGSDALAQNLMAKLLLVGYVGRTVCSGVAPGMPKESCQEAETAGDPSRQEGQYAAN
jgi:hypothetical protein